ncbi:protein EARLY RESPONSIVE TO DEHYDRATION 15 [Malania oleifera]|uniref:protein EARLY RESPONSIVE TO DEHYDRATION 15 n=1 Tax=Malania oleifera TaxID=397392 RepID=UPI0025AE2275|nr:protein EARLY RESPONSIVE TO DEHYDRATION 15 [Malania oleifera]XP_057982657.1 protein EARLY RESPONSIVE TO DEHYDRATION 15 [Malania oleifera]
MALVSGRSTLNPDAPLFIPAALRQVEDFSPEWWDLITTSTWFRDYWLSQHKEEDIFGNGEYDFDGHDNDVVDLLPDTFDLGAGDDFPSLEVQFEEFIQSSMNGEGNELWYSAVKQMPGNGFQIDADTAMKNLNLSIMKSPRDRGVKAQAVKNWEKPAQYVNSKCSPRRIQQPR